MSDKAPTKDLADELSLLVNEYDPGNSDWGFRKGIICGLIDRLTTSAETVPAEPVPAVVVREPVEWHWRCLDDEDQPTSKWFVVDGPLEEFKRDMEADRYEIRPLYATPHQDVPAVVVREVLEQAKAALIKIRTCSIAGCDEGYGKPEKWADDLFKSHGDVTKAIKAIDAALSHPGSALEPSREEIAREIPKHTFMDCSFDECNPAEQKAFLRCADAILSLHPSSKSSSRGDVSASV